MPTTMPKAIAKILTIACDDDRGGRADTESETDGDSDGAVSMTGPQHCKKSSESSLPLSLPVIPTSQLRRAISDLEEELSILPKRSATHQSPKYKGPVIVDHANLYSKPPKPPSTVADEASRKMTQSVANRILQGGAALPCGHEPPRRLLL